MSLEVGIFQVGQGLAGKNDRPRSQHECCERGLSYFAWGCFRDFVARALGALPEAAAPQSLVRFEFVRAGVRGAGAVRWCRRVGFRHVSGIEFREAPPLDFLARK